MSDRLSQPVVAAAEIGLALLLAAGCSKEVAGPQMGAGAATTGSLVATITTAGLDLDPNGYMLSVDSGTAQPVSVNGSLTVSTLGPGNHSVLLGDNAVNCTIAGTNPRLVSIQAGDTARVGFSVTCIANAATLLVKVGTTGADLDPDGYTVRVDAGAGLPVAVNGAVAISGLYTGNYFVSLDGVAANCVALPESPVAVTVYSGLTTEISFGVTCVPTTAVSGKIAFISHRDGNWAIYAMGADGSYPTRLTSDSCDNQDPAWSPDGRRIAFTAYAADDTSAGILVMNADRSGETGLCGGGGGTGGVYDMKPAWSPDGTKIAFIHQIYGENSAYVTNADGTGGATQLTHPEYADSPYDLAWSPDGQKIAYSESGRILVMDAADGSNKTLVMMNGEAPAWSPDGTRMAFQSHRDGNSEIYVMNADGTGLARLTANVSADIEPDWSPDGTKIVFASSRTGNFQIYVMNLDGSGVARLTNDPVGALEPRWKLSR
jgi:Tol biopolymer transport system component